MIYICNLAEMRDHVDALKPSHVITLLAPADELAPPNVAADCYLRVSVHDIDAPMEGLVHAEASHLSPLIDFIDAWNPAKGDLLVHCFAGISRSTATALIALAMKAPAGREAEAARHLRAHAPHARPNRRLVEIADQLLDRKGRLNAAVHDLPAAELAFAGPLVQLPLLAV